MKEIISYLVDEGYTQVAEPYNSYRKEFNDYYVNIIVNKGVTVIVNHNESHLRLIQERPIDSLHCVEAIDDIVNDIISNLEGILNE